MSTKAKREEFAEGKTRRDVPITQGYVVMSLADAQRLMRQNSGPKETAIPSLKDWFRYLFRHSVCILSVCVVCTLLAMVFTVFGLSPEYTAVSKLSVTNSGGSAINLADLQMGSYLASDYSEVFKNWYVHERVLQMLDLPYTYTDLERMLEITNPPDTRLLYITVTSSSAAEAKQIADAYAAVAQEFIAVSMDTKEPYLFEEALLPSYPSSPSLTKNAFAGYLLGGVAACTLLTARFLNKPPAVRRTSSKKRRRNTARYRY